jgi:hypothetical protein
MQTTLERPIISTATVSEADAQRAASAYVATHLDPVLEVVDGARYHSKPLQREVWRFFVRCAQGPVGALRVDVETGAVIQLTDAEICAVREKAAILVAKQRGTLPADERGYVLAEYARRQASSYLNEHLSMFYGGVNPIFVPGESPVWQVTIVFKRYEVGPFTLGVLDIDAKTGHPIPLSAKQIKRIRERTRAIIRPQTSPTATS